MHIKEFIWLNVFPSQFMHMLSQNFLYVHLGVSIQHFFYVISQIAHKHMWMETLLTKQISILLTDHNLTYHYYCLLTALAQENMKKIKRALFSGKTHHMIRHEHCTWPMCLLCVCIFVCERENEWHSIYVKSPCACPSICV